VYNASFFLSFAKPALNTVTTDGIAISDLRFIYTLIYPRTKDAGMEASFPAVLGGCVADGRKHDAPANENDSSRPRNERPR